MNKKKFVIAMITVLLLGLITPLGYWFYKKQDDAGFCWARMKRLDDDELYQATMLYMIDYFQEKQKKQRRQFGSCERAENCKIWMIKEPLSIPQIKQKMELSWNKRMAEIIEIFEMQAVDRDFVLKHLQQNNNGFTLYNNTGSWATFASYDCCEVVPVAKVAQLKIQYQNDEQALVHKTNLTFVKPEEQPAERRYLRYKKFESGIHHDSGVFGRDGLTGKFDFEDLKNISGERDTYFPLTSCGKILSN